MNHQQESIISCPYCGELINVLIDPSDINQEYIEDCQVCCRPINFSIQYTNEHNINVIVRHENE